MDVLTHECGHAFEGYVAERDPKIPADLECPGMESAEIHSMAMEFLTAPWHHLLFGKDTDKYALLHAEDSFLFLAYGCAVDEFQHIMYQNPDLNSSKKFLMPLVFFSDMISTAPFAADGMIYLI